MCTRRSSGGGKPAAPLAEEGELDGGSHRRQQTPSQCGYIVPHKPQRSSDSTGISVNVAAKLSRAQLGRQTWAVRERLCIERGGSIINQLVAHRCPEPLRRHVRSAQPNSDIGSPVSIRTIWWLIEPDRPSPALLRHRRAHRGERFFQGVELRLYGGELRAQRADIEEHLILHRGIELGGVTEPG